MQGHGRAVDAQAGERAQRRQHFDVAVVERVHERQGAGEQRQGRWPQRRALEAEGQKRRAQPERTGEGDVDKQGSTGAVVAPVELAAKDVAGVNAHGDAIEGRRGGGRQGLEAREDDRRVDPREKAA